MKTRVAVGLLAAGAVLLSACSSSPAAGTAAGTSAPTSSPASVGATSPSDTSTTGVGGTEAVSTDTSMSSAVPTGSDLATKGCNGIKIAHAQALVTTAVMKIEFDPGSAELDPQHQFVCQFDEQAMSITVYPEDTNHANYKERVAEENGTDKPLTGIGDQAVYSGVVMSGVMTSAPTIITRKGSVTCIVETPGRKDLTIPIDPGPIGGSTVADAVAYAGKMGALCQDIFTALS